MEVNLTPIIKDSFLQFGGAVLQSRALPDARDLLKPSARQIFYCLYTDKFIHEKPFQKTLKAIGSCFRLYIHGDSSAEGIIMRAGQPFAMRYPLVEIEGGYGTLLAAGSWSAPRYSSARLSALANYLFSDIQKETIAEWRDNYDNTEQYPMVLPSKGFFNLVNGGYGIGVGASSSCPQYNLKELNNALIKLLWDNEISYEEIYCAPDFATGAILLNEADVKESMKNGNGAACKLRSVVEWNQKERCLVVTEIPYMVYTETICKQLEEIVNGEDNPGIERFNDLTGKAPLIKIYLTKNASPDKVLKFLYKNTSLQTHYSINFTMLENGRYPKVFSWRELLLSHLKHEQEVYTRGFNFDLRKINSRLHIIDGLIKAISLIDEVVKTIKQSTDTKSANIKLQELLSINENQAKAILELKLSRLTRLDISKLENEKNGLMTEKSRIEEILNDETLLKKEIEKGLREVANKFGDERRTKIVNLCSEDEEPTEIKQLSLSLSNLGNVYVSETSSLYVQRKGGVGAKVKMDKGEYIISNTVGDSIDTILFFTNKGNFYHAKVEDFMIGEKNYIGSLVPIQDSERICASTILNKSNTNPYLIFITKNGIIKKSLIDEYNIKRGNGAKAIELKPNDEIISVLCLKEEGIGILSKNGNLLLTQSKDIRAIGRTSQGIKGIKLDDGDYAVAAHIIPSSTQKIISITKNGLSKQTTIKDFVFTGKNTKGKKIQKINDGDCLVDFAPIINEKDIVIVSSKSQLKISINEISEAGRAAIGTKTIKISEKDKVICIQKI